MTIRIGCLGEVMLELIAGEGSNARLGVAGDTYNTAVYLADILGPGLVDYLTVLGEDGFSARIRAHMALYNIGAERVLTHPTRIPGLYAIETDAAGERSFTYWRSQSAARTLGDSPLGPMFEGLSHLFYSGISLAILSPQGRVQLFQALDDFRRKGGVVVFDSNYRPKLWESAAVAAAQTEKAWRHCDIALPSVDDEQGIFGDESESAVVTRLRGYGIRKGALKRGAEGPLCLDLSVTEAEYSTEHVVDSTAAGDSFNAGYLAAIIKGRSQKDALKAGHALASRVVGQPGAIVLGGDS